MHNLTQNIATRSRQRYVRWNDALWDAILAGPARTYAQGLGAAPIAFSHKRTLLEQYLNLVAEGLGLGHLVPYALIESTNFFSHAFLERIPNELPGLPPERQLELLAAAFNLGENLAQAPAWLRRLVEHCLSALPGLDGLEKTLQTASERIFNPPGQILDDDDPASLDVHWLHLGEHAPRFLPGTIDFLAPTVLCVHGREAAQERIAIWIEDKPMVLGTINDPLKRPGRGHADRSLWDQLSTADPRLTKRYSSRSNTWRSAATLESSQYVILLAPRLSP